MSTTKEKPLEPMGNGPGINSDSIQKFLFDSGCKDTTIFDNPIRLKILELLLSGERVSNAQLSKLFNIPDPRSHLRYIRQSGIMVLDCWHITEFSRYKVYFIPPNFRLNPQTKGELL